MADTELKGQVALVTGGSSGLGAETARELGRAGAGVAINFSHSEDEAQAVARDIESEGGSAITIQADVSQEAEVRHMFDKLDEHFGRLDILVNNAGIQKDAAFLDMSLDDWSKVLNVNLTGQFLCARSAAQRFIDQDHDERISCARGKIICMSSVHEAIPWACRVNYAASKGGVMQLMKSMAQELAHLKIRVNSVAPGAIKTPINRQAWESPAAERELLKLIPYGRIGEPSDVARAVRWLASDLSDYVHGETIFIDGGMMLYPGFREGG